MGVPSGVGAQWGFSPETTYGTYVAPARFLKLESAPWKRVPNREQGGGLNAGRLFDEAARYVETAHHAEGSVKGPVTAVGFGSLFRQAFGSAATPTVQGATAAYLQTHTVADLFGISSSQQVGVPSITNGTANPYTALGAKVKSIEFTQEARGLLQVEVTYWAQDLVESQSLVAATYTGPTEVPFNHAQWAFKIGAVGAEAVVPGVSKFTFKLERVSKDDLDYANSAGLGSQPITNDRVKGSGTITADFMDKTVFADRFTSAASFSMINQWTGSLIASTFFRGLGILTPSCKLEGNTPTVENLDIVSGDFPYIVLDDLTNVPLTLTYMSTDTVL